MLSQRCLFNSCSPTAGSQSVFLVCLTSYVYPRSLEVDLVHRYDSQPSPSLTASSLTSIISICVSVSLRLLCIQLGKHFGDKSRGETYFLY